MTDTDEVKVEFRHFTGDHTPGERVALPADEAKRFVRAGVAVPATVTDAKRVAADPETAATKRS